MIWLLLSDKKIDHASLEAVVQPFRNQSGASRRISPPLTEALAAAEQTLGKPIQAADMVFAIADDKATGFSMDIDAGGQYGVGWLSCQRQSGPPAWL